MPFVGHVQCFRLLLGLGVASTAVCNVALSLNKPDSYHDQTVAACCANYDMHVLELLQSQGVQLLSGSSFVIINKLRGEPTATVDSLDILWLTTFYYWMNERIFETIGLYVGALPVFLLYVVSRGMLGYPPGFSADSNPPRYTRMFPDAT